MNQPEPTPPKAPPTALKIADAFARYGNFTLGGGSATTAALHRELLEKRGWISTEQFTLSFALARLTPGTNLLAFCTGIGWLLRRWPGALAALLGASVPCTVIVIITTVLLSHWQDNHWASLAMQGAAAAAVAITVKTSWTIVHPFFKGAIRWRVIWVSSAAFLMYVGLGMTAIQVLLIAGFVGAFLPSVNA